MSWTAIPKYWTTERSSVSITLSRKSRSERALPKGYTTSALATPPIRSWRWPDTLRVSRAVKETKMSYSADLEMVGDVPDAVGVPRVIERAHVALNHGL